ncbi:MAG: type I restriction enzyme HsdR N-terminal domain-containing protein [Flavobacteriaceae bacterium]
MQALNFPSFNFRFKNSENKVRIFDIIRKKFVVLQPEEWVRQHTVHYLIYDKNYSQNLLNVERLLTVNGIRKRYDIVVYNSDGSIEILVECKSPEIQITQEAFDQIARYNMALKANYLMVTNGITHFYCQMDYIKEKYTFLQAIPDFSR